MSKAILAAIITLASLGTAAGTAVGQTIAQSASPTYSKDVAPILYKNCTSCHRPGEIAPMSLLTFTDARPWIKSIGTQVAKGAMPPWHADPAYGEFLNDRRLSAAEKDTLLRWVNAGGPEGDPKDLPAPPKYADGWAIGQPDVVFEVQEDHPLPASGTVAYQYFEVPTTLTEDRWVQAVEVRPGNRATVHHVIVYMRPPETPAPAQPAAAQQNRPRPQPAITFADGMDIPAGQTGGPALPDGQKRKAGAHDRPMPKQLGPSIRGLVPGKG